MEKRVEPVAVRSHDFSITGRGGVAKVDPEHAADTLCRERQLRASAFLPQTIDQRARGPLHLGNESRLRHKLERGKTRSNCDRISRKRASLVDRTERRD